MNIKIKDWRKKNRVEKVFCVFLASFFSNWWKSCVFLFWSSFGTIGSDDKNLASVLGSYTIKHPDFSLNGFSFCEVKPETKTSLCWWASQKAISSLHTWLTFLRSMAASWRSCSTSFLCAARFDIFYTIRFFVLFLKENLL